ncbi:hypothetical protein AOQ84DRAFT_227474 [Glonium stellatum]|uniref:Wax synthase domain-containing protein n=1 Tax=Glonium stellatum TaxID=574774 RepID=A0A8E2ER60_9PEZI|nr:hypothetical protein AOQ84DRAFT_227474 [Glonium stellatum]
MQIGLTGLTVGFTKPSSPVRPAMLIFMLLAMIVYIPTAKDRVDNIFQVSWGTSQAVLATYQYIDVALVNRWDFEFSGPQPREPAKKLTSPYGTDIFWNRSKFDFYTTSSFRNCVTPFETRFITSATLHLVTCYPLLDALTLLGDPEKQAALFAESRISLLSRLVNYLVLSTSVTAISLIMVATGMSEPAWWKPLFNFGNGFPFTVLKNRIFAPSTYITDNVLKLSRGSLVSRYMTLVLTFIFSAGFHGLGDIACGIPLHKTGASPPPMAQVAAIVVDDLVQYM